MGYAVDGASAMVNLARGASHRILSPLSPAEALRENDNSRVKQREEKMESTEIFESSQEAFPSEKHKTLNEEKEALENDPKTRKSELDEMKEDILAGKYDAGFETLLDEFDDTASERERRRRYSSGSPYESSTEEEYLRLASRQKRAGHGISESTGMRHRRTRRGDVGKVERISLYRPKKSTSHDDQETELKIHRPRKLSRGVATRKIDRDRIITRSQTRT